jgi:hypothetical protein
LSDYRLVSRHNFRVARHSTATRKIRSSFTTFSLDSFAECTGGLTPVIRTLAPQEDQSLAKGGFSSTKLGCLRKMRTIAPNQGRKKVKHGGKLVAQRLAGCPAKLLISKPDRIVTRDSVIFEHRPREGEKHDRIREMMAPELRQNWLGQTLVRDPIQGVDFLCPDLSYCDGKIVGSPANPANRDL